MPSIADNPKAPHVPNHEMVRSIGRGSYGEIWLARSLTGTWRAVNRIAISASPRAVALKWPVSLPVSLSAPVMEV